MSTIKPRTAEVVIYQGDDLARLAELRQAAEVARRAVEQHRKASENGSARMGDAPSAETEQDAYDAFVEEAAERAVTVEIRAIGRKRFKTLLEEHPPRKVKQKDDKGVEQDVDHADDAPYGVDVTTFPEALLSFIDSDEPSVRTIAAPKFEGRKAVQAFIDDELADGDFETLWNTAYMLNRGSTGDPKASRYGSRSTTAT